MTVDTLTARRSSICILYMRRLYSVIRWFRGYSPVIASWLGGQSMVSMFFNLQTDLCFENLCLFSSQPRLLRLKINGELSLRYVGKIFLPSRTIVNIHFIVGHGGWVAVGMPFVTFCHTPLRPENGRGFRGPRSVNPI